MIHDPPPHLLSTVAEAISPASALPCSLAQQRFWFLEQFEPGNPALNVAVRWQMNGIVTDAAIEHAFQTLINRHEILRTRFVDHDGEPRQVVLPTLTAKITLVDLSRLTPEQCTKEAEAISLHEAQRPFDLVTGPPARLAMLRLDERRIIVLLTMHHIATDGWTMGILSREFGALVGEAMGGPNASLPTLDMQFADYALWQSDMIAQGAFDADADYWRTTLAGLPHFEVKPDRPRPPKLGTAGDFNLRNVASAVMDPIEAMARRQGQTMYSVAATALAMALAAETGNRDVVIGTQVAGRDDMLLEPIAGLFINTLVLRLDLTAAKTGRAANELARRVVDGALAHQRYPFEKLVEMLNPPRDPAHTPLYSVNFTLIRQVIQSDRFGDIDLVSLPSQLTGAQYDLLFFMVKRADGWRMVCESSSALYDTATAHRILARWEGALCQLLEAPDAPLAVWTGLEATKPTATPAAPASQLPATTKPLATAPVADVSEVAANLQTQVLTIWRDLLARPDLQPTAHFFESGGHSLLALRMLSRVRTVTGTAIPVATLFQKPVLADFVAAIGAGGAASADAEIAVIQSQGTRPPVIALNDGAVYHPVAEHIGRARPFISLHLAAAERNSTQPLKSFEDFAAEAVRLIKRAQPEGPYTLIGHCVFGAVAYEAAQQLRRAGDQVSLVAMLDTLAPGYVRDMPLQDRLLRRIQMLGWSAKYFVELTGKLRRGEMTLGAVLFQYGFIRRNGIFALLERLGAIKPVVPAAEDYTEVVFGNLLLDAQLNYHLKPYAGDVVQFRAHTAREGRLFDRGFGWARWIAGSYDVITVPSDHFMMMRDPAATVIGQQIAERLEQIETAARARK